MHPRTVHIPGIARRLSAALYAASVWSTVRAEVKRFRPDVILSACAYPDGTAAVALGAMLNVPVVVRAMGTDINQVALKPGRRGQIRWAMKHSARVIAVSGALGDRIQELGVARERIAVVPTGVDAGVFHPRDRAAARAALGLDAEASPVVVVVARLSPEKGILHLLHAMSIVGDQLPFRLVLAGDGPQRATLEADVVRRGLADRVRFDGFQPEGRLPLYYAAADLSCLPSLEEGWPDVVMESFACGCPVLATKVGGVPDMLALTRGGLLVPPGDPEALARGLAEALGRIWDRDGIAACMRHHSIDRTARDYLDVCEATTVKRAPALGAS